MEGMKYKAPKKREPSVEEAKEILKDLCFLFMLDFTIVTSEGSATIPNSVRESYLEKLMPFRGTFEEMIEHKKSV